MSDKITSDCKTGSITESIFTKEEILRNKNWVESQLEQEKLNSLIPTEEEIRKAETELQIITLLQEVNLI